MEEKSLVVKVKNFLTKTEDEREVLNYSIKIKEYLSMTHEEFQSKKIMVETKLATMKVKFTFFISVLLIAFLSGFTDKMFKFLNTISAKMVSVIPEEASVFDRIFVLSIVLYLIILLVALFVVLSYLKGYFNLIKQEKIITQASIMRENKGE